VVYVLSLMLQHISISEGQPEGRRYKIYKYTCAQLYAQSCVQNCGLCTKLDIMHVAFSSNMYKTIRNEIKFNVKNVK
jgi:hypothetical protein